MLRLLFASIVFLIILLLIIAGTFFLYMILMPQLPVEDQVVKMENEKDESNKKDNKSQVWKQFCDEYDSLPSQTYLSYLKLLASYPSIVHEPFAESLSTWLKIRQNHRVG